MTTGLELYEALKPSIGQSSEGDRRALPLTDRVAAKADLEPPATKADLHAMETRMFRWMLGLFATRWLGNAGLIVTIVLKF